MIRKARTSAVLVAATAMVALAACGGSPTNPSGSDRSASSVDRVTYLTAFGAAGRDAFAWIAQEKGYFRQAGLDVDIELGKATGENLKALASGRTEFANLDLTGAMISAGAKNGEGYRGFRAILAVHQQTLVAIMSMKGSGITTPKDLAGKRIAAAANSVNQLLFPGYAQLAGVDADSVNWVAVQPVQLGSTLASGKVDALSTFLIGRPAIEKATLQARQQTVTVMPYSTYLPDLFGNAVITSEELAVEKPDLVKRFREAMRKALVYTVRHPDEAGALLHARHPETAADVATQEIELMTPSVTARGEGSAIGLITRDRAARALASLRDAGLIGEGIDPQDVIDFNAMPKG
ncbi:ABC transporter substrate-binding protein [Streptomyces acidicola]|uniref:ABC transporter substrate-binding protein n=1 Tax=Streptomyces acidicola TaxID=2596892 RepID=UPI00378CE6AD